MALLAGVGACQSVVIRWLLAAGCRHQVIEFPPVITTTRLTGYNIFKGAATTVITQRNKDPIYGRYTRLLDSGTKPTLAKLSLARLIAATVLRMWKDEQEYDPERAGSPTATREG